MLTTKVELWLIIMTFTCKQRSDIRSGGGYQMIRIETYPNSKSLRLNSDPKLHWVGFRAPNRGSLGLGHVSLFIFETWLRSLPSFWSLTNIWQTIINKKVYSETPFNYVATPSLEDYEQVSVLRPCQQNCIQFEPWGKGFDHLIYLSI